MVVSMVVSSKVSPQDLIRDAELQLKEQFAEIEEISYHNQIKVLKAFRNHRLSEEHFGERTGYGIDDPGRAVIDGIYAEVMECPSAAVRIQLVSGTHALACALYGNLKAGEKIVVLTGKPYDTLAKVIGNSVAHPASLIGHGILYSEVSIEPKEVSDQNVLAQLKVLLAPPATVAYIQKSCGYSFARRTYSNQEIATLCRAVRQVRPDIKIIVDNCYGEFVERLEPTACGADLIAGSLIKNPGGGLAVSGGYLAGKTALVEASMDRLTAPGIGGHQGVLYNQGRLVLQGLFLAPTVVSSAVKGALLLACVFEKLAMNVKPSSREKRFDIIQAVELQSRDALVDFCRAVQQASPVNAHVLPEPSKMPGYEDEVVMAGGSFIEGSTIELSADGPLRPPFVAFVQGGLTYAHTRYMVEHVVGYLQERQSKSSA
jgi:cystathionine beta-lyase family protein involved in aluminum resistance